MRIRGNEESKNFITYCANYLDFLFFCEVKETLPGVLAKRSTACRPLSARSSGVGDIMNEKDFSKATKDDRNKYISRPYEETPQTELVEGALGHLLFGKHTMVSFLTMKAGSTFPLHSHPEEQIMIVVEGYCDEVIEDKVYRISKGDVIWLPSHVKHGAFVRDVDCKAIDVFSSRREDYRDKFLTQHSGEPLRFL